jgi:hypothetical protein
VPIVECVGNRPMPAAGLVKISRSSDARFDNTRLRRRSAAVRSGVSRLIF